MLSNTLSAIASAIHAGNGQHAEQLCREGLVDHPSEENLLLLLAMSLQRQGRPQEAVEGYAQLIQLFPESSLHWTNYGTALTEAGSLHEAHQAYCKAIELDCANILPRTQLGALLMSMHQYMAARHVLLDALVLDEESPFIRISAARACCLCQDFDRATELVDCWQFWTPLNDDLLQLELAQVLTLKNDVPAAAELLEDLANRSLGEPKILLLLASAYERLNRIFDAQALLTKTVSMFAAMTSEQRHEADHLGAALAMRERSFLKAKAILEQCGARDKHDFAHYFQLAGVYDKLGAADEAMATVSTAHHLEISERTFASPEFFEAGGPAMPVTAPGASIEQYARWPSLIAPSASDSPVLIVGFPRSGTTLLEQMLDAHPSLQSMDENPFFNRLAGILTAHDPRIMDDLSVLRQYDCDELRKLYHGMVAKRITRHWDKRLVDKNPLNMQWLPMIHRLFPQAKIVLAVRHPCDVLLSCYMQSFRSSILVAACSSLERLAHAYMETMHRWLEQVSIFNPSIRVSRYEDLVSDFANQSASLADFLELKDAAPLMAFDQHAREKRYIATPSYSQVIEPINHKGVGRWQKYRRHFEPLLPILEPMVRHWGYPVDAEDWQ